MFEIDSCQSTSDRHSKHVILGLNFEDIMSYVKYVRTDNLIEEDLLLFNIACELSITTKGNRCETIMICCPTEK